MKLALELSGFAALLLLSAFFAVSETSLFSLRPWRIERLRREKPVQGAAIERLVGDPLRLLVTIVVGAELTTIALSNLSAVVRRDHLEQYGDYGVMAALGATSLLSVLLGEITPKSIAANYPEWCATQISRPLGAISRLLYFATAPLAALATRIPSSQKHHESQLLSETDFRLMVDRGRREGSLGPREVNMISAVFRLGDLPVHAVMVPRTDMIAIPSAATAAEALGHIRQHRHSRVPVYERDLDHITGILYAKDLLGEGIDPKTPAGALARPPLFVPEMMPARRLIREFQGNRLHLAVVVDEYGGTSGLVSLEDLLEEIVGDIADDFDRPLLRHRQLRRGLHWVHGSMPFSEFKKRFRLRAAAGDWVTIAGYMLKLFGRVPTEGEKISDKQFAYTIVKMGKRRVLEATVERSAPRTKKDPGGSPGRR